jgi:hypothetical protein
MMRTAHAAAPPGGVSCFQGVDIVKRWNGGATVEPGFYWSEQRWAIFTADGGGSVLPGGPTEFYRRIPAVATLLIAPVMGGVFAMFLPLIGFLMVFREIGARVRGAFHHRPRPA